MKKIALILFAFCIISGCNVLDKPKVVKKESVSSVKKESNLKKADVSVQIINEIDFDNLNGGLNDYNIVVPKKEGIIKKNVKIKANDTQNYSFTFNYIGNETDKILKGKIDVK